LLSWALVPSEAKELWPRTGAEPVSLYASYSRGFRFPTLSEQELREVLLLAGATLVVMPLLVNIVVRNLGWVIVLSQNGLANKVLGYVGLNQSLPGTPALSARLTEMERLLTVGYYHTRGPKPDRETIRSHGTTPAWTISRAW